MEQDALEEERIVIPLLKLTELVGVEEEVKRVEEEPKGKEN